MSFVQPNEFTGEINLSQNSYVETDFQAVIDRTEEEVLRDLLGDDLYIAFMADLSGGVPQTAKYVKLLDGENYLIEDSLLSDQDDDLFTVKYSGLKLMLRYFCFFEQIRTQQISRTNVGATFPNTENATRVDQDALYRLATKMYNKGVVLYCQAYNYIEEQNDKTNIEGVSGTTILTNRTKLMADNDTVDIGGTDYVVSSVVANTSFDIPVSIGTANYWQEYFYPNWDYTNKGKIFFNGSF